MTNTKKCITCGVSKTISEFPPVIKGDVFNADECKHCRKLKTQKRYRVSIKANPTLKDIASKKVSMRNKKIRVCAKTFCPKIDRRRLIEIICPVCMVKFGVTTAVYNSTFAYFGRPPKYCSKACYYKSLTKKWRQTRSPYANRINALLQAGDHHE